VHQAVAAINARVTKSQSADRNPLGFWGGIELVCVSGVMVEERRAPLSNVLTGFHDIANTSESNAGFKAAWRDVVLRMDGWRVDLPCNTQRMSVELEIREMSGSGGGLLACLGSAVFLRHSLEANSRDLGRNGYDGNE